MRTVLGTFFLEVCKVSGINICQNRVKVKNSKIEISLSSLKYICLASTDTKSMPFPLDLSPNTN